jgi:hypothetical protein
MSLGVALQSVFYYVMACSTCRKCATRRKQKKSAASEKKNKDLYERDNPDVYHHPSPFTTNIYWHEEMQLGPGPPPQRGGNSRTGSQRVLTGASGGPGSSQASSSQGNASVDGGVHTTHDHLSNDSNWNRRRYQREDERLWGQNLSDEEEEDQKDQDERRGSKTTRLLSHIPGGVRRSNSYYTARNPPVNELHPPVVSTPPTHPKETEWMLQPPPHARVMSGQQRANASTGGRSRSVSGGSSRLGTEMALGRVIGDKLMEEKLRRGEQLPLRQTISLRTSNSNMYEMDSRPSRKASQRSQRRRARDTTNEHDAGDADDDMMSSSPGSSPDRGRSKRKTRQIKISEDIRINNSPDVADDALSPTTEKKGRHPPRPILSTIASLSDDSIPKKSVTENDLSPDLRSSAHSDTSPINKTHLPSKSPPLGTPNTFTAVADPFAPAHEIKRTPMTLDSSAVNQILAEVSANQDLGSRASSPRVQSQATTTA